MAGEMQEPSRRIVLETVRLLLTSQSVADSFGRQKILMIGN